ncbi:hypothetical protein BV22DRAFT_1052272, partial [Leucogyrophana mollusca]
MVTTRPGNATKKVAEPVLAMRQKRRSPAEVMAAKVAAEEERDKATKLKQQGLTRIAEIQDKAAAEQTKASSSKQPRPRPRKAGQGGRQADSDVDGEIEGSAAIDVGVSEKEGGDSENIEEEDPKKGSRSRKTSHRDAINALRTIKEGQDTVEAESDPRGGGGEKGKNIIAEYVTLPSTPIMLLLTKPTLFFWNHIRDPPRDDSADKKQGFMGSVSSWRTSIDHTKQNKSSAVRSRTTRSAARTRGSKVTSISKKSTLSHVFPPPSTAVHSDDDIDEQPGTRPDRDDSAEHEAQLAAADTLMSMNKAQRGPASTIRDVSPTLYDQPPFTQKPSSAQRPAATSPADRESDVPMDGEASSSQRFQGTKRSTNSRSKTSGKKPGKKGKGKRKASRTAKFAVDGDTTNPKRSGFTTDDLPAGATDGNLWRGYLLPSYAKWNGSQSRPW